MNTDEIRGKVKEIIADVAGIDAGEIADEAHFFEDLDLDSLALLEMGVDVDYAFKLGVPDEDLKELRTVPQCVALVETWLAKNAARADAAGESLAESQVA
jgi:acyl carrier protein